VKLGLLYEESEGFSKRVFSTSTDLIQFLFSERSTSLFIYLFICPVTMKSVLGLNIRLTTSASAAAAAKENRGEHFQHTYDVGWARYICSLLGLRLCRDHNFRNISMSRDLLFYFAGILSLLLPQEIILG
jgi:hypothetical protein